MVSPEASVTVTFGAILLAEEGRVNLIEDCVECELVHQQREMALQAALAQESMEKAKVQTPPELPESPEQDAGDAEGEEPPGADSTV